MNSGERRVRGGVILLFLVSGAPALAAQLAWSRIFSGALGHELPAIAGVVSAFFAGTAAGAWLLGRRASVSRRPGRWYAGLEAGSALWIAGTTWMLDPVVGWSLGWMGPEPGPWRHGLVAFLVPLAVVGPSAAALGGTLPAMERVLRPLLPDRRAVSLLYAANTLGAVLGVVVAVGWVMPGLGFRAVLWLASGIQAACALWAWWLAGRLPEAARAPGEGGVLERVRRPRLLAAATGFLGIGYEILGIRILSQSTENTVHTFAATLSVFLVGTALGSALQRLLERRGMGWRLEGLLGVLGLVVLAEGWVSGASPGMAAALRGVWGAMASEVLLAGAVFLAPTVLMGMVFSQLAQRSAGDGLGVGGVVAWNALGGAMAGPAMMGVLLPGLGVSGALVALGAGYLLAPGGWNAVRWVGVGAGVVLALLQPRGLRLVEVPAGAEVTWFRSGRLANVAVVRTADGHRALRVNNRFQQGGTATAVAARRQAHLPLLLHPNPRRALFLGVGTGISMAAAGAHAGLEAVGVELLPEVIEALPEFRPENEGVGTRPSLRVVAADARRFVRTSGEHFDVIVGDLFHPSEDGAGMLYTREHFSAIRGRLAPGGLFCQWLPLHQLDMATFADVARTFLEVFPDASLWLLRFNVDVPVVGLIGMADGSGVRLDMEVLGTRLATESLRAELGAVALQAPARVAGCLLAGNRSLWQLAGAGEVAVDDRPHVLFRASLRARRETEERVASRLQRLLERSEPGHGDLLASGGGIWVERLGLFRRGRDLHLRGLTRELEGNREGALEDYLASAAVTPEYTGGYAQAVLVASAFARENPALARHILQRLERVRPEERLAGDLLRRLTPGG